MIGQSTICPEADDCRKRADFYLARRGRLIPSATVDLERTKVVPSVTERGLYAKYQLRTDITYQPTGIQLLAPAGRDERLYGVGAALERMLVDSWGGPLLAEAPQLTAKGA